MAIAVSTQLMGHPGGDARVAELTARIEVQPGEAELYLRRGDLHRRYGHWREAAADYDAAEALGFDATELLFHRGRLWLDTGEFERARRALNEFLARHPDHVQGLIARAQLPTRKPRDAAADLERGRYAEALEILGQLPESIRIQPAWRVRRGDLLSLVGRESEARIEYRASLAGIESLPNARRSTRAMTDLERELRARLAGSDRSAE